MSGASYRCCDGRLPPRWGRAHCPCWTPHPSSCSPSPAPRDCRSARPASAKQSPGSKAGKGANSHLTWRSWFDGHNATTWWLLSFVRQVRTRRIPRAHISSENSEFSLQWNSRNCVIGDQWVTCSAERTVTKAADLFGIYVLSLLHKWVLTQGKGILFNHTTPFCRHTRKVCPCWGHWILVRVRFKPQTDWMNCQRRVSQTAQSYN